MTDNIIRAIRATVDLDDYSFDAYELPDGEKEQGTQEYQLFLDTKGTGQAGYMPATQDS